MCIVDQIQRLFGGDRRVGVSACLREQNSVQMGQLDGHPVPIERGGARFPRGVEIAAVVETANKNDPDCFGVLTPIDRAARQALGGVVVGLFVSGF